MATFIVHPRPHLAGYFQRLPQCRSPGRRPYQKTHHQPQKLLAGDATWSTSKLILGWALNTETMTIGLPLHKATRLTAIVQEFQAKTRISRRQWQHLLGELRHKSTSILGAKVLFSVLQHVLTDQKSNRLRLRPHRSGAQSPQLCWRCGRFGFRVWRLLGGHGLRRPASTHCFPMGAPTRSPLPLSVPLQFIWYTFQQ
jgi:hypothetical protein